MSDLTDRQAEINCLNCMIGDFKYSLCDNCDAMKRRGRAEEIEKLIINMPRWIPCEERVPDSEEKRYWICTDSGYQCQCRWTNANPILTSMTMDWHWNIFDLPQYSKVVAWMPLPEPYKEEK